MESLNRENGRTRPADEADPMNDARRTRAARTDAVAGELTQLLADVEDLLRSVGHLADPQIGRVRAKIEAGVAASRQALADGTLRARRRAAGAVRGGDRYVRERPWQTAGFAAALGLIVGVYVTHRLLRDSTDEKGPQS